MAERTRPARRGDVRPSAPRPRREPDPEVTRRRGLVTLGAVLLVVALLTGGPWVYARVVAPQEREPLVLPEETHEPATVAGPLDVEGTWQVGPGSEAGYRIDEVLAGEAVTVVGRTQEVTGALTVTGGMLTQVEVAVDMAGVATDESARDAYFRRALDTTTYPQAVFRLTEPVDVSGLATAQEPVLVPVAGTLTLHGVDRPVTLEVEARRTPDGVQVAATAPVVLEDFGLSAPDLGFVTVEPQGTLELLLELTR
ncbi:YceI family protein [Cellulomonas carbonis]|uniref:Lipid/polyisoprenoid-binding YceI-like domain-containing protein n=1 Tax=Cellulomonas carbonis T26 TaxID=947969 RepID=A0A0A0BVC7_9CELL|nr:YceI family protein [Cellulomonas carbonis]KGM11871.1 hypothetical protein N868_04855 [Cellulomonas carbonis T26]GGB91626.1 hypothetical protein GCM10010972_00320 [Cellulomonas carbonis]